jgi:catechol 2,3-dioxygenase-like lactoylglutathione lyase family enzyme
MASPTPPLVDCERHHTGLPVEELQAAVDFYTDKLGKIFSAITEHKNEPAAKYGIINKYFLSFFKKYSVSIPATPATPIHISTTINVLVPAAYAE